MMLREWLFFLAEITAASSVAIVLAWALSKPLRQVAGSRVAYWLWALVPLSAFAFLFPAPERSWVVTAISRSISTDGSLLSVASSVPGNRLADGGCKIVLVIWVLGALLAAILVALRQRIFTQALGELSDGPGDILIGSRANGPMLVGVWRPEIIVPADFQARYSASEQELVLAHERAHQQRNDTLLNAVAVAWLCVFWFNPLIHWAIGRFRFAQELACDAYVAAQMGQRRYAAVLLKTQLMADQSSGPHFSYHWHSSHPLKERIAMLNYVAPSRVRRITGGALIIVLSIVATYAAWASQPRTATEGTSSTAVNISANRVTKLENGDIQYSGNVVIKVVAPNGHINFRFDFVHARPGGGAILEGNVRFEIGGVVLKTDRAEELPDGAIKMESALSSALVGTNVN